MKRLVSAFGLALVLTSLWGGPALASCVAPPPIGQAVDDARAVFVGTVTSTSSDDRWATVEVSEVWRGEVAAVVEVRGGPEDPAGPMEAASSVDRTYREGETYLFLPYASDGDDVFLDNSCSSTTRFSPRLEHLRPAGTVPLDPPGPGTSPDGPAPWPAIVIGAAAGAVVVAAWAWRRRASEALPR